MMWALKDKNAYMLFNKRSTKVIKIVWSVIVVLIIISMILLYAPVFWK